MSKTGFSAADILLPSNGNYEKWAVVACDQFTSQPEYWERLEKNVGDSPSTFRIILPEAQLSDGHTEEHIAKINATMKQYLEDGVFTEHPDTMIYLERVQSDGKVRKGLIGKIDLEEYDYSVGSTSLVRATEGTVLDRIPPRQAVGRDAAVELPHVMLLIDDVDNTVIGPLKDCTEVVYDFDLMEGGGHAKAWFVPEGFITIPNPKAQLEVGTLQSFLDKYIKENGIGIDYVHGDEITIELGKKPGCMAFLLPAMDKGDLFKSVINDGALPRKTFSMGHAEDKRYYIEARKIK